MRKHLLPLLTAGLLLLSLLSISAFAQSGENEGINFYVSDVAGLMKADEWQELENKARQISEQYGCGTYIVVLDDYKTYGNYSSFWNFSETFYTVYNLGMGAEKNGILLLLSMKERDYSLIAYGSDAHYAFTDYGKNVLEKSFLDDFRQNRWYAGFRDYLNGCEDLLNRASRGEPLDVSYDSRGGIPDSVSTAVVVLVPLLSAFGVCEGLKRQMKPVSRKSRADEYIVPGGINFDVQRDIFVNRTVTRTVIRSESRNDSLGGGTTVNSHGFSGHSGKF